MTPSADILQLNVPHSLPYDQCSSLPLPLPFTTIVIKTCMRSQYGNPD
jgi:hypothetical protein